MSLASTAHRKFVWSGWPLTGDGSVKGWRMLLEIDEANNLDQVLRKYTWGLDLAGQTGGAGVPPASLEQHDRRAAGPA